MLRRTILFLPALVALIIYLPSLRSDFVYDARVQILTDNYIHEPSHLKDVLTLRVLSHDVLDNDRPVHLALYLVESLIWKRNPFGYHLTSILLHSANVLMLTFLIARWIDARDLKENTPILRQAQDRQAESLNPANQTRFQLATALCVATVALLYAVHPINVEPVAEPSYREDLLATFFTLAGLLVSTFVLRSSSFILIPFCFLLGIASKENAIVGPPVVLLYWLFYRRRESWKRWLTITASSFLVVLAFLLVYEWVRPEHSHIFLYKPPKIAATYAGIVAKQARVLTFYFGNLVHLPRLSADYPLTSIDPISQITAWIVVTLFILAELALLLQSPLHLLAAAMFWLGIATVCNIIPIYRPIADRFLYLPLTGITVHLAILILPLARRFPLPTAAGVLLFSAPLIYFTVQRQHAFHDSIALWSDTLKHNPDSYTAFDNLAFGYYDAGDYSNAVRNWQLALKHATAKSLAAEAFAGMSLGLDALDHHTDADVAYQRAISLEPRYATPQTLLDDLEWERPHVAALQKIVDRNRGPGLLSF